jgi:hypothetical protein
MVFAYCSSPSARRALTMPLWCAVAGDRTAPRSPYADIVETVRLYAPRRRLVVMLLGAAGFMAACLLFLVTSLGGVVGDVIGVLGIAFFGSAGVYIIVDSFIVDLRY